MYRVIHKTTGNSIFMSVGMIRALKMIALDKMSPSEQEKLKEETSIMIEIDHANIVKLFEVFKDEQFYYLVSEYCDGIMLAIVSGGELFEKIRHIDQLSEQLIASYMK